METENNLNYFSCLRDFVKLSFIFKIRWLKRIEWNFAKLSQVAQRAHYEQFLTFIVSS